MGYAPSCDYPSGNFAPLIDKMLGNAFWLVKLVADNIPAIQYLAQNMDSIVAVGPNTTAAAASAAAAANSMNQAAAFASQAGNASTANLLAIIASLPTVPPSQPGVLWNNGGIPMVSQA
jgi:hypothetical protein